MKEQRFDDERDDSDRLGDAAIDSRRDEFETTSNSDAFYGNFDGRSRRVLDADFQDASSLELLGYPSDENFFDDEEDENYCVEYGDELEDGDFDEDFDEEFEVLSDEEFDEIIDEEDEEAGEEEEVGTPEEIVAETPVDDEFSDFDDFNSDEDAFDEENGEEI